MKLKNRVAIITGASRGIGFATAKVFLQEGAAVIICDKSGIEEAAAKLSSFGTVEGFGADVCIKEEIQAVVDAVLAKYKRIDILINNAGITQDAQMYKMTDEQFDRVIEVNLKGTYLFSKAVLPAMMEQKYGKIVHISSVSGFNGSFGQANYAASKAGIMGMTRVMAKELGKYGITVNAVAPGSIATEMLMAIPEELKQKKIDMVPLKRFGEPEEVGTVCAFLASEEASYVSGETIVIDGGRS